MKIKGMNGDEHSVASAGVGNTALGLGIAGTALGLGAMNGNGCGNSGLLGALFGGNCGNNGGNCLVDQRELAYATALAACQGREFALSTARQEDAAIFAESRRTDDRLAAVLEQTNKGLVDVGVGVARLDSKVQCLEKDIEYLRNNDARNLNEAKEYTDCKVNAEAQLRKAGDDNIASWTQAELNKKIDGTLKIDGGMISYGSCKPVLQSCPCGSEQSPFNVNVIIERAVEAAVQAVSRK